MHAIGSLVARAAEQVTTAAAPAATSGPAVNAG
jgi:hypothetical protein